MLYQSRCSTLLYRTVLGSSIFLDQEAPFSDSIQSGDGQREWRQDCIRRCVWAKSSILFFPGGSDGEASAYNVGDPGSNRVSGRSPGEGNGNPLQCSCLENPRDGGAWWVAIYAVAQSRTQLKRLSSSSKETHSKMQKRESWKQPNRNNWWHTRKLS